jgi:fatty acid desaturase
MTLRDEKDLKELRQAFRKADERREARRDRALVIFLAVLSILTAFLVATWAMKHGGLK